MYLAAVSAAKQSTTLPGPKSRATSKAAYAVAPEDMPTKIPSSLATLIQSVISF